MAFICFSEFNNVVPIVRETLLTKYGIKIIEIQWNQENKQPISSPHNESHMENFYTAYTRVVQDTTFYFVKKYITFPEYKDVPGVLESYGMHTDFNRACQIALIDDIEIRNHLLADLKNNPNSARVIQMNPAKAISAVQ